MLILAISTSSKICSVALLENDKTIKELNIENQKTHSENLVPLIDELLKTTKRAISGINLIACDNGPGSFTGIRIGISTVKAIAEVNQIPVVTCSSLEGLSYNINFSASTLCSLIDARNNQVYCGIFDNNHNLLGSYLADDINVVVNKLSEFKDVAFVGDGAILHKNILCGKFEIDNNIHASNIGICAFNKYKNGFSQTPDSANPMYLRKSQAERMKDLKC